MKFDSEWHSLEYDYPLDSKSLRTVCCDLVNRGVALYRNNAYFATLDNHIVVTDAGSGKLVWNKAVYTKPGWLYNGRSAACRQGPHHRR